MNVPVHRIRPHPGFTLLELLILVGILMVLVGLLLPTVQKVQEASARAACANHLGEIGLAAQACHDIHKRLPPAWGRFPLISAVPAEGTFFYHLLPFLGHQGIHQLNTDSHAAAVRSQVVPQFRCPADPTGPTVDHAPGNYNLNLLLVEPNDFGCRFLEHRRTGHTNRLILLAERYNVCQRTGVGPGEGRWAYRDDQPHGMGFGSTTLFQVRPHPAEECRYDRPQSGHPAGMNVGIGDGSVRFCSTDISPLVWAQGLQATDPNAVSPPND